MSLSQFDIDNVDAIIGGHGSWFTAELLRLIAKADINNRQRLRVAFPDEVHLWESWYHGTEYISDRTAHDSMCPYLKAEKLSSISDDYYVQLLCECALIARVRADNSQDIEE